ncbi:MAG: 2,5-dichloro-2,5-cyclohexadiene-1,4-diol dehydrogenase [Syntrophorhabdaceae bacterium PtaU1.Bin034]|nr:MAG: 2,5-dichloro-2,5-cyclohexadiene-1,4-diol dehydrogenase [Syntrophorhabdaceae bacterium PtaU1.Bin034]
MREFDGKVAVVTGAGGGIGRASAVALAEKGAKVAVADVLVEQGLETAQMIKEKGGEAIFVRTDVSDSGTVQALVNKTVETYGRLDYAVNNAGIGGANAMTADYPEDDWNRIIAVNLTGVWLCMKYEIPQMLRQGKGVIVNVASVVGLTGLSLVCGYAAAKHGVVGLTKVAGMEYAAQGVRVASVCPGFVETPMMDEAARIGGVPKDDFYKALGAFSSNGRVAKPEEIAAAVVWLCSDAASFVTGTTLVADGGWICGYRLR